MRHQLLVVSSALVFLIAHVAGGTECKVTGTVADDQGRPLSDAEVILYYHHSWSGYGNEIAERTQTDADGKFTFEHQLDYEQESHETYTDYYVVLAKHPDFSLGWSLVLRDKGQESVHMKLGESKSQTFQLTGADGKPLKGGKVWLRYAGNREDVSREFRQQLSLPDDIGVLSGTTDEKGQVTIGNIPDTRCSFSAAMEGYSPELVFRQVKHQGIAKGKLSKDVKASGVVRLASGRSLPGTVVWFVPEWIVGYVRYAKTDAEGRFHVDGLFRHDSRGRDARYRVKLRHARFAAREQEIQITNDQPIEKIEIQAVRGTVVRGRVLEPDTNRPLPGARVQGQTASGRVNAYANDRGEVSWLAIPGPAHFMFTSPPSGVYVESAGSGLTSKSLDVRGDEVEFVLYAPSLALPLADLKGRLVLPDGSPAAGLPLHAVPTISFDSAGRASYIPSTATNQDGTFQLDGVPTGTSIGLYAETKDRKHAFGKVIPLAVGQDRLDDPIVLSPTKASKIVITDDNAPLIRSRLKIRPIMGTRWPLTYDRAVVTDKEGKLVVSGLVPGLKYFVRDAKANLSDGNWTSMFHKDVILVPTDE